MNFQVPQFIEEKSKIVGFLTLEQFLYIAGGGGLIFIMFYTLTFFLWILLSAIVAAISASLAFAKVNGQRMPQILLSAITYITKPRIYTWQRATQEQSLDFSSLENLGHVESLRAKMSIGEKLKSIALSVTTGKILSIKEDSEEKDRFQTIRFITGERGVAKKVDY